ncbi:MAG: response regulator [Nitrospirota bacterium]
MKILLADDNQDIVHLARRKLENEGYDVFSITNGAEALDIVKSTDIDIMVLNINLPYLRWNKINKTMKEKTDSPVIFILPENLEREIIPAGTNIHYIQKPFHPDELYSSIRMAVQIKKLHLALKDKEAEIEKASVFNEPEFSRKYVMKRLLEETSKAKRYKYSLSCLICEINKSGAASLNAKRTAEDNQLNDYIMKQSEKIVANCTRKSDIIARYNANKFIILLPHTFSDGAIVCSEKIIKRILDSGLNSRSTLSINIGTAIFPVNADDDQEQLINRAVKALKKAKKTGSSMAAAA